MSKPSSRSLTLKSKVEKQKDGKTSRSSTVSSSSSKQISSSSKPNTKVANSTQLKVKNVASSSKVVPERKTSVIPVTLPTHKIETEEIPTEKEEVVDEYEDDFENYESDFEEELDEELSQTIKVNEDSKLDVESVEQKPIESKQDIVKTNAIATPLVKRNIFESENTVPKPVRNPVFETPTLSAVHLDFRAAKLKLTSLKASTNLRKRWEYLKNVIAFEHTSSVHFSQPPISYELFMNLFGANSNSSQVGIQTGEDDIDDDTQTDRIEVLDQWTQFPPHLNCDYSRQKHEEDEKFCPKVKDWSCLVKFVRTSSKIMCRLLEEEFTSLNSESNKTNSKSIHLELPNFMKNCSVVNVASSKHQPYIILVSYRKSENSLRLSRDFVLQWDTRWPNRPQRFLTCYSQPLCCSLDYNARFGFAGMIDGSIAVWDLEECDIEHNTVRFGDTDYNMRSPSYSTAEVLKESGHNSPVVTINCVEEQSGVIQVISLEESGVFHIWILMESSAPREDDLGMAPQSRVHLFKTFTVDLLDYGFSQGVQTTTYIVYPSNHNLLLVATDAGLVISTSLILNKRQRTFRHQIDLPVEVTALSFFSDEERFLAGFKDQTVQLFTLLKEKPIKVWYLDEEIRNIGCSHTSVFVLGGGGTISFWKCLEDEQKINKKKSSKRKPVFIAVLGNNREQLLIGYENGHTEINVLVKNL